MSHQPTFIDGQHLQTAHVYHSNLKAHKGKYAECLNILKQKQSLQALLKKRITIWQLYFASIREMRIQLTGKCREAVRATYITVASNKGLFIEEH